MKPDVTASDMETVVITRSDLRGTRRAASETPPLVRGKIPETAEEAAIEVPTIATEEPGQVQILHVDDEPEFADLAKTYLERVDDEFTLTTAASVVEGLNLLENEDFDCIISDYDMPTTNGIEFLEIVRKQYPDLPFILYTGKGSEEVASEAIASGVTDYMQKETGTDQYEVLANRVRNAVENYRAQEKFWDALTWYQRLVEQNLTGVFIIQEREFMYVNQRFADTFGYSQAELVGSSPMMIASDPEDESVLRDVMTFDHQSDETFRREFTGVRADGTDVDVEIHGGSIQYNGDPGCIGVLWDQSE